MIAAATLLVLVQACAAPVTQQQGAYAAEITAIDAAAKRITLKASMGMLTVRVAPGVALGGFKPGDKVRVNFGQDGSEPVVTRIDPGAG